MFMLPVPMQMTLDAAYYDYQVILNGKGHYIFCHS